MEKILSLKLLIPSNVEGAMYFHLRVGPSNGEQLSDEHSKLEPPDPISNSEVKRLSADGSVGSPHVRVGHRQAFIRKRPSASRRGVFFCQKSIVK